MSKLDNILSDNHGNSVFGESFDEEKAKEQIKALILDIKDDIYAEDVSDFITQFTEKVEEL